MRILILALCLCPSLAAAEKPLIELSKLTGSWKGRQQCRQAAYALKLKLTPTGRYRLTYEAVSADLSGGGQTGWADISPTQDPNTFEVSMPVPAGLPPLVQTIDATITLHKDGEWAEGVAQLPPMLEKFFGLRLRLKVTGRKIVDFEHQPSVLGQADECKGRLTRR